MIHPRPAPLTCALLLVASAVLVPLPASAAEPLPASGRYLPLYPGLYLDLTLSQDERDRVFDANGDERDSALPNYRNGVAFPEQRLDAAFTWTFPLFERDAVPFLSSRLHTARVQLGLIRNDAEGPLAAYIAGRDDYRIDGSGVGDLQLEFGSYLWGSGGWRGREAPARSSGLLLLGLTIPTGVYEHEAPINAGSNQAALHATLGAHWQPWAGSRIEAGYRYRAHRRNEQPQFSALAPTERGDDQRLDLSLMQRVHGSISAGLVFTALRGAANVYEHPLDAPNAPPPPDTTPPSDRFPTPGRYRDEGTALQTLALALEAYPSQRLRARLAWLHPLSGESGEFDLPFTNRQPAGCIDGALGCQTREGDTVRVDGLGPARAYASDSLQLSLTYQFGQGDPYTCTGCRR